MIALKNVLWWICSLMHGKLLLALMGAVCAGEGERHLPPAFKSRLIMFCLFLSLCGMPKATYNWKFCGFLKFLLPFLSPFWPFLIVWSWRIAGWGCCFRGCVFSVLPCFQIPAYFLPLSKAAAIKQREACGECAPKMLEWITSPSLHSRLETKLAFDFGFPVELISLLKREVPFCVARRDLYLRADGFRIQFV